MESVGELFIGICQVLLVLTLGAIGTGLAALIWRLALSGV